MRRRGSRGDLIEQLDQQNNGLDEMDEWSVSRPCGSRAGVWPCDDKLEALRK